MFSWFDEWASEGMVAVRDGGGPAADRFLTSDLQRIVASAGILGPSAVLAVIGPGMDRAARLYPFLIAGELPGGNVNPPATLQGAAAWFGQVEEIFLAALAPDFQPERLEVLIESVTAPDVEEGSGNVTGLAFGSMEDAPDRLQHAPAFATLFGGTNLTAAATGGGAGQQIL